MQKMTGQMAKTMETYQFVIVACMPLVAQY